MLEKLYRILGFIREKITRDKEWRKISFLKNRLLKIKDDLKKLDDNDVVIDSLNWDLFIENKTLPDIIFVGDNPGYMEKEGDCYLSFAGTTGRLVRVFFCKLYDLEFNLENYVQLDRRVLFFEKTAFYSNKTSELNLSNNVKENQNFLAEEIFEIANELNIPIWIVGTSSDETKPFYDKLKKLVNNNITIYITPHFTANALKRSDTKNDNYNALFDDKEYKSFDKMNSKEAKEFFNNIVKKSTYDIWSDYL